MRYIRLYVDHPKIGCGFRAFLVVKTGRIWAHLVSTDTAEAIKVPVGDLKWAKPLTFHPRRRLNRLRRVAKEYGIETEGLKDTMRSLRSQCS